MCSFLLTHLVVAPVHNVADEWSNRSCYYSSGHRAQSAWIQFAIKRNGIESANCHYMSKCALFYSSKRSRIFEFRISSDSRVVAFILTRFQHHYAWIAFKCIVYVYATVLESPFESIQQQSAMSLTMLGCQEQPIKFYSKWSEFLRLIFDEIYLCAQIITIHHRNLCSPISLRNKIRQASRAHSALKRGAAAIDTDKCNNINNKQSMRKTFSAE